MEEREARRRQSSSPENRLPLDLAIETLLMAVTLLTHLSLPLPGFGVSSFD